MNGAGSLADSFTGSTAAAHRERGQPSGCDCGGAPLSADNLAASAAEAYR
jgi:hypothetical protein